MADRVDVLMSNAISLDVWGDEFEFVPRMVCPGGIIKAKLSELPSYSQEDMAKWVAEGIPEFATARRNGGQLFSIDEKQRKPISMSIIMDASISHVFVVSCLQSSYDSGRTSCGGAGNTAPLMARAGLKVVLSVAVGRSHDDEEGSVDVPGRAFCAEMERCGVDVRSALTVHPQLPTSVTYIYTGQKDTERSGLVHCANANDAFDFTLFKHQVQRLRPKIVYFLYSGISAKADANGGKDLAEALRICREEYGCVTIADTHTVCRDPREMVARKTPVPAYQLLQPLLPQLDIFFTSSDEARLIFQTLCPGGNLTDWERDTDFYSGSSECRDQQEESLFLSRFLRFIVAHISLRVGAGEALSSSPSPSSFSLKRTRLFGVTHSRGAVACLVSSDGAIIKGPTMFTSPFSQDKTSDGSSKVVVSLVGAGDAFRGGVITYIARNIESFLDGSIDLETTIQMGNMMAFLYITAPLSDRSCAIPSYQKLLADVLQRIKQ